MVPMLGGPDEIMPMNAVVPINGTFEKVQQAFERARNALDRGELYRNPLEDGEIVIPPGGGLFGFIPGPQIMGHPIGAGKGKEKIRPVKEIQNEAFPRADLTFDLSDLMALPDLNAGISDLPPQTVSTLVAEEHLNEDINTVQLPQPVILIESDSKAPVRRSPRRRQLEEPLAKKSSITLTYERRRSERLKHKLDGDRVDSVERASQRKACSAGESDSSVGSASSRHRKTRLLLDINKVAPLPITACPLETSMSKLEELAACCGFITIEAVEQALRKQEMSKDAQGTSKRNE
jgi:hypothetical protein